MAYEITLAAAGALAAGAAVGYWVRHTASLRGTASVERGMREALAQSEREGKEIVLKAQERAVALLEEVKRDERERKTSLDRALERLAQKEERAAADAAEVRTRAEEVRLRDEKLAEETKHVEALRSSIQAELAAVGGLTADEARERLMREVEGTHREELARLLQRLEREKLETVEQKSVEVVTTAIQRYARSHVADITTTSFVLPGEDLKGKIIGREGRNIRTLERLTGVEFVIDETPDTILISSFDPLRREVARLTLEKLIRDGRIQPAKIEEKVAESQGELEKRMQQIGEEAAYEVGIIDLPKEIIQLLGRLHFRTSFGQNALTHSIEVAHLSGMMSQELGESVDAEVAKKGGLLHDIGKAIDHEVQGSHIELGMKILKKYNLPEAVILAMRSHHDDYPFATSESFIVAAAAALSAARPGARRGTLENYVKRLQDLERIAASFGGVKNAYAISAGRELRIFVVPEKIDDFGALQLAKDIAGKIESELQYPGEIKVKVIREVRAVEYAR